MKIKIFIVLAVLALVFFSARSFAADTNAVSTELKSIVQNVQAKLKQGKDTESDLAPDLKAFDDLLAKHKDEKTDAVAQILMFKASLYFQVLNDTEKGTETLQQLKRDYPSSQYAQAADHMLEMVEKQAAAEKVRGNLKVGAQFPDFHETDLAGSPLSISNYKGKVVLLDFWATWCGPCRAELPNVLKTYEKHHAKGFEIIGISLDEDKQKLETFIKQNKMTWPQFFDGKGWENKLSSSYGVTSIPATYLLDGDGKIIGQNLRGEALDAAVAKALAKK